MVLGVWPVGVALLDHNTGTSADPDCVRRCYTFVHRFGTWGLVVAVAPLVLAVAVLVVLRAWDTHPTRAFIRLAWGLAGVSCVIGLVGLLTPIGMAILAAGPVTAAAVLVSPGG